MVEGGGFEPPKASPTDLQSVPFDRSGTPPRPRVRGPVREAPRHRSTRIETSRLLRAPAHSKPMAGFRLAGEGTRTPNHLITNERLYQLSYASGPSSSRKEEQRQHRQPAVGCQDSGRDGGPGSGPGPGLEPRAPGRAQAKRQPDKGDLSPTLRLPLPERTTGDREEPRCSPGFVDRAYLVFLSTTNHSSSTRHRPIRGCSHPFLVLATRACPTARVRAVASPATFPSVLRSDPRTADRA